MQLGNFALGAVGAILAWLTTEFIGRPFRHFFDLRGEVSRRLVQFDNVMASARMIDVTHRELIELPQAEKERLTDAQNTFRDLASQMRGFAQAEPIATGIVKSIFNYDPFEVSAALIGLSNEISTAGPAKAHFKSKIRKLLRIREGADESADVNVKVDESANNEATSVEKPDQGDRQSENKNK